MRRKKLYMKNHVWFFHREWKKKNMTVSTRLRLVVRLWKYHTRQIEFSGGKWMNEKKKIFRRRKFERVCTNAINLKWFHFHLTFFFVNKCLLYGIYGKVTKLCAWLMVKVECTDAIKDHKRRALASEESKLLFLI